MKIKNEKIIHDIQMIQVISQNYNLTDQKEIDRLYRKLKGKSNHGFFTWVGTSFYEALRTKTSYARRRKQCAFFLKQVGLLAFLTAALLLGVGAAYEIRNHDSKILRAALQEMKEESITEAENLDGQEGESEISRQEPDAPTVLEEYQRLYSLNSDLAGWIIVEGTNIDYPVLQKRENPDFYLSHDFFGNEDRAGSIFLDGEACVCPKDGNIVLYGHNMSNGDMFGSLKKYRQKAFCLEHPVFEFDTLYEKSKYQVAAVLAVDISQTEGFSYYDYYGYDSGNFQEFTDFLEKYKLYDTGYPIVYGDNFVMLSTCSGNGKDGRLVVVGVEK